MRWRTKLTIMRYGYLKLDRTAQCAAETSYSGWSSGQSWVTQLDDLLRWPEGVLAALHPMMMGFPSWEILSNGKFWRKSVGNYSDKRSLDELQICTRTPFVPRNLHQFIFVTPTLQSCSTNVSIVSRSLLPIFSYITNSTGTKHRNENKCKWL